MLPKGNLFINKSAFLNKVLILIVGAGIAQIINLVLTVFLTRIYNPDQFGILGVFLTTATFLSIIATGRYDLAVILPKEDGKAKRIISLALLLTILFCVTTSLVFLFSRYASFNFLKNSVIEPWFYLLPIGIFLVSGGWIFNAWTVRQEKFKLISTARIGEASLTGITSILLKAFGTTGLIVGNLIGPFFYSLLLSTPFFQRLKSDSSRTLSLKSIATEYNVFPKINILQSFLDLFQFSGLILLFTFFFPIQVAGLYALCLRILQAPMGLIVKPIAQVYFSEISKAIHNRNNLYELTYQTAVRTAIISLPIPLIILLFGPFLFSLVFGTQWAESGWYARIFVLWFYFDFIRSPISQLAIVLHKQPKMLLISFLGNLLLVISLFALVKLHLEIRSGFVMLSVIQVIYSIIIIRWLLALSKSHVNHE
jgi:O-antigen/teichoic acid export membrane protein